MAQPDLIPMPFAENATPGTIEPIQATTPTAPQDATWSAGFPQVTMLPLASGGIPPRGQNFNGVLNALSQHIFHMQGGGQYKWDAAHGPYSIGDVLQSDDGLRSYVSAVDNNTDNFNTTPGAIGTSWQPWSGGSATEIVAGLIKIATASQAVSGTDNDSAMSPQKTAALFPFRGSQTYGSPGVYNWTVPSGVTKVYVEVIGGGGGGGKRSITSALGAGGGAGGGGISRKLVNVTPGTIIPVTVGVGGAGATAITTVGATGGSSSFGSHCSASGGFGGGSGGGGGTGGVGSGGDFNSSLGPGGGGISFSNSVSTDLGMTGAGGGPGGNPTVFNSGSASSSGSPGAGPGGGGAGAVYNGSGGAGHPGFVSIFW